MKQNKTERRKALKSELDRLARELVTDPEKMEEFARSWQQGFWPYSFGNRLLIMWQYPEASLCAGFQTWKKAGRFVKKRSKAIKILAPRYFVKREDDEETGEEKEKRITYFIDVPIFAYEQTDGKELNIGHADKIKGAADYTPDDLAKLFDIPLEVSQGVENGWTNGKKIVLSKRENPVAMLACFFHELAHVMLHYRSENAAGVMGRDFTPTSQAELEAEATGFLVCSCLGIENEKAKYYIANWKGSPEKIQESAQRIIRTAEKILNTIKPNKKRSLSPSEEA